MPDTYTPFYDFTMPEISGSPETWGNKLNGNFAALDAFLRDLRNYIQNADPIGIVKSWAGTLNTIPANHVLCDGSTVNGVLTPDLRERFIVGGKDGSLLFEPGDFGGSTSHNHGGATQGTAIGPTQIPPHAHTGTGGSVNFLVLDGDNSSPEAGLNKGFLLGSKTVTFGGSTTSDTIIANGVTLLPADQGKPHNHVINTSDSLPPYYTLAFIMRVSYPWT